MRLRFYGLVVIVLLLSDNTAHSAGRISITSFKCDNDPADATPYHLSYPGYAKVLEDDVRKDAEQRCQLLSKGHAYDIVITFTDGTEKQE